MDNIALTNNDKFAFHRLTADSSPKIFEVLSELDKQCIGADGWSAESFRTEAAKDNGIVICCYGETGVAALICGYFAADQADITSVAVHPDYRRKGLGMQLIADFQAALPEEVTGIFLEVRSSNEGAIALYEKSGFQRISVRKNFYINPREDAIVMQKKLS